MDQLDMVATKLTPLSLSIVFPGQLCAARFSLDGGMYRARVSAVTEEVVSIFFIDYGDTEEKDMAELFMLPEELLQQSKQWQG